MRKFKQKILMVNCEQLTVTRQEKNLAVLEGKVHLKNEDYIAILHVTYMKAYSSYGVTVSLKDEEGITREYLTITDLTRRGVYSFFTYFVDYLDPVYRDFIIKEYKSARNFFNRKASTAEYWEERLRNSTKDKRETIQVEEFEYRPNPFKEIKDDDNK